MGLLEAVERGDLDEVRRLLDQGADLEEDAHGDRPLVVACRDGKHAIAELLLDRGADPTHRDDASHRPLVWALGRPGRVDLTRRIAERAGLPLVYEVAEEDDGELDPEWLEMAAATGASDDPAQLSWVLAERARAFAAAGRTDDDPIVPKLRGEALRSAAGHGAVTVVEHVLAATPAPSAEALQAAVRASFGGGRLALVARIAGFAGTLDRIAQDPLCLHAALSLRPTLGPNAPSPPPSDDLAGARWLLDRGADPNAVPEFRRITLSRPIEQAVSIGHLPAIRLLIERGARVTPRAMLSAAGTWGLPVLEPLVAGGGDPAAPDTDGRTPLMAATASARTDAMRWLIDRGARVDVRDAGGATALGQARTNHPYFAEVEKLLRKAGARDSGASKPSSPRAALIWVWLFLLVVVPGTLFALWVLLFVKE